MSREEELKTLEEEVLKASLPLKETAANLVFGKGSSEAGIVFIGEAPGAKEDLEGKPFVGQAGKELDRLLGLINLSLQDVYIANILKYRPPENRNPLMNEIESHAPFLIRQIQIIQPKLICTLGNYATKFVLAGFQTKGMNKIQGISQLHGKTMSVSLEGTDFKVMPLYHPAAMLYNGLLRKILEEDFLKIKKLI